ncbi:MAG: hypothetical protein QXH93_03310 [Conexivisphaerales archaeon]
MINNVRIVSHTSVTDILSTLNGSKVSIILEVASLGVSVLPLHAIDLRFPLKVDAMLY